MASRMVADEEVARTPEELEAWIEDRPDIGESLERGGYGTKFDANDLHPLLMAFVAKQGGGQRESEPSPTRSRSWWIAAVVAVVVVVILVVLLVAAAPLSGAPAAAPASPLALPAGLS